jgi:hypothetical protein
MPSMQRPDIGTQPIQIINKRDGFAQGLTAVRPLGSGTSGTNDESRMNREVYVRFCERVRLRCPARPTYLAIIPSPIEWS